MLLKVTLKVIGPQRGKAVSGGNFFFFNYHRENSVTLGNQGSATPGTPASYICICRGLCLEVLGGGGGEGVLRMRGGNEVHLEQLLELIAFLMLLSVSACRAVAFRARGISNPFRVSLPWRLQRSSSLLPFFETHCLLLSSPDLKIMACPGCDLISEHLPSACPQNHCCLPLGSCWNAASSNVRLDNCHPPSSLLPPFSQTSLFSNSSGNSITFTSLCRAI